MELNIVSSERDHLIELSNKLKTDVSRLEGQSILSFKKGVQAIEKNEIEMSSERFTDDSDTKDFAKSLWSNAILSLKEDKVRIIDNLINFP